MSMPSKVLWGEELFLRPRHFQQQERYHEARLNQTACALHPYCRGVRNKFVLSALPGAIPVRPDTCYFVLDARGARHEAMRKAQSISVYVPNGLRELRVEPIAVSA